MSAPPPSAPPRPPAAAASTAPRFLKCRRCYSAAYCDGACQRAHWGVHKRSCKDPSLKSTARSAAMFLGTASGGPGNLIDPSGDPSRSVLYEVLGSSPPFGAQMPLTGTKLDTAQLACVAAWISSGGKGGDGGVPDATLTDAVATTDAPPGDSAVADAVTADTAAPTDAGHDAATPHDTGAPDTSTADSGPKDSGGADASAADASAPGDGAVTDAADASG